MAFRGSISRPLLAAARSASRSTPPPLPRSTRLPSPLSPSSPLRRHSLSFAPPRSLETLGGAMSLLPLHNAVAAARLRSHLSANARACCELSQGS